MLGAFTYSDALYHVTDTSAPVPISSPYSASATTTEPTMVGLVLRLLRAIEIEPCAVQSAAVESLSKIAVRIVSDSRHLASYSKRYKPSFTSAIIFIFNSMFYVA